LRLDVAWRDLISRLNEAGPPIQLTTPRTIACNGYGWAEFINHAGCASTQNHNTFFQRAGAWLALFHCFAATDMHQENIIAAGDHPIPIDLETLFHVMLNENQGADLENNAMEVAKKKLAESVMAVGLLPAYGRSPENKIFAIGGMTAGWETTTKIVWSNINSDEMHPARAKITKANPNLPHADGRYAIFADYIDDFIAGFASYARFLSNQRSDLFRNFEGLTIRRVLRPTRFYYMLLQRLKNHQTMNDGVLWSVQADFIARLTDWDQETDPLWAFLRSERLALTSLNVPLFVAVTDGHQVRDLTGFSTAIRTPSGLDRVRNRVLSFDEKEISWQIEVIKQNTSSMQKSDRRVSIVMTDGLDPAPFVSADDVFLSEAKAISDELSAYAIRRGNSAAWIGLDWLGDAEVFQLSCLGPDLYNGASGIAVFLAAQAAVTNDASAGELALNAVASIRNDLKSRNAARFARSIGIGGATGLGSIIYAFTVMSKSLRAPDLLAVAHAASELLTDDLIAADKQLDVVGGCAGAILGLLRLYRDSGSDFAINRAIRCADHLLSQPRIGAQQQRSWVGQGLGPDALNGMSHGAAGFAYALAKLSGITGRQDFAGAASECMAFENSSYDEQHHNWPDKRAAGEPSWPCQWCHGAPGIGLARLGMAKSARTRGNLLFTDIQNAVEGTNRGWPGAVDTLCCGTLGSIEFLAEAGAVLQRIDLQELARQRLLAVLENAKSNGDYRWNSGNRRFNLGLFRGLAGVGYALLRRVDKTLPNILIWE
jgi:type 2 lantibiotic biosynthesis protein LanM